MGHFVVDARPARWFVSGYKTAQKKKRGFI